MFDILEARLVLETELTKLCALRITDEEILELRNILELKCHNTGYESFYQDILFHKAIAKFAKNKVLYDMYINLLESNASKTYEEIDVSNYFAYNEEILHLQLFNAIEERDPLKASEYVSQILKLAIDKI